MNKQKLYASLLILGASVLFFRTIRLLTVENGWNVLADWVIILTLIESVIDTLCIIFSFHWLFRNSNKSKSTSLRLGATAAIFHALRVLIFVLGRTVTWFNFDVKPQFRSSHEVDMFWVYFASIAAILGILGVYVIWKRIKRSRRQNL